MNLLNPLTCPRISGFPPHIVLMLKLLTLGLVMKGFVFDLSDHFLPFFPIFEYMGSSWMFQKVLQFFFLLGAAGILFNKGTRVCCLILGLVFLTSVLSSRTEYTNVKFFCGCIYLLTFLSREEDGFFLVRWQIALVYWGAAINKLFEADWRNGQYFENWLTNIRPRETYLKAAALLPPMWLSTLMGWATIFVEFVIAAALIVRPLWPLGVWLGAYFHCLTFLISWYDFKVFLIAILASYLVFVRWPEQLTVYYNPQRSWQRGLKAFFAATDWDRRMTWQTGPKLGLDVFGERLEGFLALKRLILYAPVAYFALAVILALPDGALWFKLKLTQALLILFFPLPEIFRYFSRR